MPALSSTPQTQLLHWIQYLGFAFLALPDTVERRVHSTSVPVAMMAYRDYRLQTPGLLLPGSVLRTLKQGDSITLVRFSNGRDFTIDTNSLKLICNNYFAAKPASARWKDGSSIYTLPGTWQWASGQEYF